MRSEGVHLSVCAGSSRALAASATGAGGDAPWRLPAARPHVTPHGANKITKGAQGRILPGAVAQLQGGSELDRGCPQQLSNSMFLQGIQQTSGQDESQPLLDSVVALTSRPSDGSGGRGGHRPDSAPPLAQTYDGSGGNDGLDNPQVTEKEWTFFDPGIFKQDSSEQDDPQDKVSMGCCPCLGGAGGSEGEPSARHKILDKRWKEARSHIMDDDGPSAEKERKEEYWHDVREQLELRSYDLALEAAVGVKFWVAGLSLVEGKSLDNRQAAFEESVKKLLVGEGDGHKQVDVSLATGVRCVVPIDDPDQAKRLFQTLQWKMGIHGFTISKPGFEAVVRFRVAIPQGLAEGGLDEFIKLIKRRVEGAVEMEPETSSELRFKVARSFSMVLTCQEVEPTREDKVTFEEEVKKEVRAVLQDIGELDMRVFELKGPAFSLAIGISPSKKGEAEAKKTVEEIVADLFKLPKPIDVDVSDSVLVTSIIHMKDTVQAENAVASVEGKHEDMLRFTEAKVKESFKSGDLANAASSGLQTESPDQLTVFGLVVRNDSEEVDHAMFVSTNLQANVCLKRILTCYLSHLFEMKPSKHLLVLTTQGRVILSDFVPRSVFHQRDSFRSGYWALCMFIGALGCVASAAVMLLSMESRGDFARLVEDGLKDGALWNDVEQVDHEVNDAKMWLDWHASKLYIVVGAAVVLAILFLNVFKHRQRDYSIESLRQFQAREVCSAQYFLDHSLTHFYMDSCSTRWLSCGCIRRRRIGKIRLFFGKYPPKAEMDKGVLSQCPLATAVMPLASASEGSRSMALKPRDKPKHLSSAEVQQYEQAYPCSSRLLLILSSWVPIISVMTWTLQAHQMAEARAVCSELTEADHCNNLTCERIAKENHSMTDTDFCLGTRWVVDNASFDAMLCPTYSATGLAPCCIGCAEGELFWWLGFHDPKSTLESCMAGLTYMMSILSIIVSFNVLKIEQVGSMTASNGLEVEFVENYSNADPDAFEIHETLAIGFLDRVFRSARQEANKAAAMNEGEEQSRHEHADGVDFLQGDVHDRTFVQLHQGITEWQALPPGQGPDEPPGHLESAKRESAKRRRCLGMITDAREVEVDSWMELPELSERVSLVFSVLSLVLALMTVFLPVYLFGSFLLDIPACACQPRPYEDSCRPSLPYLTLCNLWRVICTSVMFIISMITLFWFRYELAMALEKIFVIVTNERVYSVYYTRSLYSFLMTYICCATPSFGVRVDVLRHGSEVFYGRMNAKAPRFLDWVSNRASEPGDLILSSRFGVLKFARRTGRLEESYSRLLRALGKDVTDLKIKNYLKESFFVNEKDEKDWKCPLLFFTMGNANTQARGNGISGISFLEIMDELKKHDAREAKVVVGHTKEALEVLPNRLRDKIAEAVEDQIYETSRTKVEAEFKLKVDVVTSVSVTVTATIPNKRGDDDKIPEYQDIEKSLAGKLMKIDAFKKMAVGSLIVSVEDAEKEKEMTFKVAHLPRLAQEVKIQVAHLPRFARDLQQHPEDPKNRRVMQDDFESKVKEALGGVPDVKVRFTADSVAVTCIVHVQMDDPGESMVQLVEAVKVSMDESKTEIRERVQKEVDDWLLENKRETKNTSSISTWKRDEDKLVVRWRPIFAEIPQDRGRLDMRDVQVDAGEEVLFIWSFSEKGSFTSPYIAYNDIIVTTDRVRLQSQVHWKKFTCEACCLWGLCWCFCVSRFFAYMLRITVLPKSRTWLNLPRLDAFSTELSKEPPRRWCRPLKACWKGCDAIAHCTPSDFPKCRDCLACPREEKVKKQLWILFLQKFAMQVDADMVLSIRPWSDSPESDSPESVGKRDGDLEADDSPKRDGDSLLKFHHNALHQLNDMMQTILIHKQELGS